MPSRHSRRRRSSSRKRSYRMKKRGSASRRVMLKGGIGDDDGGGGGGRGQKRPRDDVLSERQIELEANIMRQALAVLHNTRLQHFKTVMAPPDRFSQLNPSSLFEKLCIWQGLSFSSLCYIFGPFYKKRREPGWLDHPGQIEQFITNIIENEPLLTFSREILSKLKLIRNICEQYQYDSGRNVLTSYLSVGGHVSTCSFFYTPPLVLTQPLWTVTLPSDEYWEKLAKVELQMNNRFSTYLLSKDPTTFQNAVIVNNGHGELEVNIDTQSCEVFTIPNNKSLTVISIASPGNICLLLKNYEFTELKEMLKDKFDNHLFKKMETMGEFLERYSRDVQICVDELQRPNHQYTKYLSRTSTGEVEDEDYPKYVGLYRPIFTRSYIPGDKVANSGIQTQKTEEEPFGKAHIFLMEQEKQHGKSLIDKRAVLLTPPFLWKNTYDSDFYTTLQNVWRRGIDHITYFDFTCRSFKRTNKGLAEIAAAGEALGLAGLAGGAGRRRQ